MSVTVPITRRLDALLASARRRVVLTMVLTWLPLLLVAGGLLWRWAGPVAALVALLLLCLPLAAGGGRRLRRFDRNWLASQLDARRRDLEDSSALLHAEAGALGPLQRLQRERLVERLPQRPLPDLRPAWPWRRLAAAWGVSVLAAALALAWPESPRESARTAVAARPDAALPGEPRLQAATLAVQPPAYTGLEASRSDALDASAPEGSLLRWTLRYAPQPAAVDLVFHDGRRLAMQREGDDWTAELRLQASVLYRLVPAGVTGAAQSPLQRLDAVADQPPRVRVLAPERGLTLLEPGQRDWLLRFEVEDDHGVAAQARLQITRTEGSGENIRFHEHVRVLQGRGTRRSRQFEVRLSPSTFGLQRGEDLVARLEVLDNRAPQPQLARSASLILRWPAEPVIGAEGLEGLARQVLPAYFRSQRQIIIDAEALLKEQPQLAADEFARRSDLLGVDQRLLRLRYGQFLGEESEGGDLPTSDLPTSDTPDDDAHDAGAHDHAGEAASAHDDGHGHGGGVEEAVEGFGRTDNVLETFGHTHDIPEAATLLDPKTREILRSALREMWQSELHLRQAAPRQALPYAHRALEFIKQVQQAERIYLQRVGTRLPPIDETRRLGGKREGIASRAMPALAARPDETVLSAAWQALSREGVAVEAAQLDALQAWIDGNRTRVDDPLDWIARIDALRQDPACDACRAALRAQVWSGLARPAGGVSRRAADPVLARRYFEALEQRGDAP